MAAVVSDVPVSFRLRRRGLTRLVALAGVAGLAVVGAGRAADVWLTNPFAPATVNRTGPAVLAAIADLSRYEAASGTFSVMVDIEHDAPFLPDALRGDRTLYQAVGTVDAGVDFSGLAAGAVTVDGDRVSVLLPAVTLGEARLDPEASYVADRDRGLLDRIGSVFSESPTSERPLQVEASRRLAAAAAEAGLVERAEANTTAMLERLLAALGFDEVDVRYQEPRAL